MLYKFSFLTQNTLLNLYFLKIELKYQKHFRSLLKGEAMDIYALIFDDYETLDLMGPVEFLARVPELNLNFVSFEGGAKRSKQGFLIKTKKLAKMPKDGVLLVPGGQGTRALVNDSEFVLKLKECVLASKFCLSVCTGSALIARTGELDGLKATSNKRSLEWVKSCGKAVKWQERARWVRAGKFYTASGVAAGMDMALGFISDHFGKELAQKIANETEYNWQKSSKIDKFAKIYGY